MICPVITALQGLHERCGAQNHLFVLARALSRFEKATQNLIGFPNMLIGVHLIISPTTQHTEAEPNPPCRALWCPHI